MNYKNSRDAAWEMLIKHNIKALPVSVQKICKKERIRLLTYKEGGEVIKKFGLEEHTVDNDAFCIGKIIFYDDTTTPQRQRFSVAHEIGHIVCISRRKPLRTTVKCRRTIILSSQRLMCSRQGYSRRYVFFILSAFNLPKKYPSSAISALPPQKYGMNDYVKYENAITKCFIKTVTAVLCSLLLSEKFFIISEIT